MLSRNQTLALKGMKYCSRCETVKDLYEFYPTSDPRHVAGRKGPCIECQSEIKKERYCPDKNRAQMAKKNYGISLEEYDAHLASPCDICGGKATELDHCHDTGKVRGGLCKNCNTALGKFKDDPQRLLAAAAYLVVHS